MRGLVASIFLLAAVASLAQPAGTKLWHFQTGDDVSSTPALALDGTLYFGSQDGHIYALRPDGTMKWFLNAGSVAPTIGPDGTIYLTSGKRLYAVDPSGALRWKYSNDELEFICCVTVTPDSTIYASARYEEPQPEGTDGKKIEGRLVSFNAQGERFWRHKLDEPPANGPVLAADMAFVVGTGNEAVYTFASDRTVRWGLKLRDDAIVSAAIGPDGTIYVSDAKKTFYAISAAGKEKWRVAVGDWIASSAAVDEDGTIYFGSDTQRLYAFKPDGSKLWEFVAGGAIRSSPAIAADGTIYFGADDGKLYAISRSGKLIWSFSTGARIRSSPAIGTDGTVYIGSDDNRLYAIKGTAPLVRSSWPKFRGAAQQTGRVYEMGLPPAQPPLPPRFHALSRLADGRVQLTFSSEQGANYDIESSWDLSTWAHLSSATAATNQITFIDPITPRSFSRFYRVRRR
jgi:outer membrane protein assembly factor BamB